jgi:protein TonB
MTVKSKFYIPLILLMFVSISFGNQLLLNNYEGEEYLAFAEQMPEPVNGLPGIYKLIKYPEIAKKAGIEGKVYVLAFINENGSVDDVKVIKGIGGGCDEATIKAVKQTKFTPATSEGKTVKVKMSLQIQFKLK